MSECDKVSFSPDIAIMNPPRSSSAHDYRRPVVIGRLEIRSETAAECGTVLWEILPRAISLFSGFHDIHQGEKILIGRDSREWYANCAAPLGSS